jgi:hypothetical protein
LRNENLPGRPIHQNYASRPGRRAAAIFFVRARTPPPARLRRPARSRFTNLRLWETLAGSVPLFSGCSLQCKMQLGRVGASAARQRLARHLALDRLREAHLRIRVQ